MESLADACDRWKERQQQLAQLQLEIQQQQAQEQQQQEQEQQEEEEIVLVYVGDQDTPEYYLEEPPGPAQDDVLLMPAVPSSQVQGQDQQEAAKAPAGPDLPTESLTNQNVSVEGSAERTDFFVNWQEFSADQQSIPVLQPVDSCDGFDVGGSLYKLPLDIIKVGERSCMVLCCRG